MTRRRARLLALLTLVVTLAHLWLIDSADSAMLGWGAAPAVRRMDVSFVRVLQPKAPTMRTLAPPSAPRPRAAARLALAPVLGAEALPEPPPVPPEPAASAALPELKPPERVASPQPAASQPAASQPAASQPAASQPAAAAAASPLSADAAQAAERFEWPPSTRLSYALLGNYRGAVSGQAQVEWLQRDGRYQVHLEVSVGPPMAPLLSRRMSSEGEVSTLGLRPRRYEEETRAVLRAPRRLVIELEPARIVLPNGELRPRPDDVQDTASQFVQMTYLFTINPELMVPGKSIGFSLALPRYVEPWVYDVLERQTLNLPIGELDTVHVKPRRVARSGDLTAEFWVAPSLQYMPVRILIRQDEQTYVDLTLLRLPEQASAASAPAASAAR